MKLTAELKSKFFIGVLLIPIALIFIGCTGTSNVEVILPSVSPAPTPPVSSLTCPSGYVLVPADTNLSTDEFCVAIYEMRNVGGVPTSQAAATPWINVSKNTSVTACQSLGAGYDLISNSQWQSLSRNIAGVGTNWSTGTAGQGYMNIGNADNSGNYTLCNSTDIYVDQNCAGIAAAGNFIYKRTHALSNSNVVWDLGGNNYELVKDLSTGGQYGADVCAQNILNTNPGSDILGTAQSAFGLASTAGFTLDTSLNSCAGLGGTVNASQNNSVVNYAVVRGGASYDNSGIFNADIGFATAAATSADFSFRCIYK